MNASQRIARTMEYTVSVWIILLSFYWLTIADVMDNPLPFFGIAAATFILICCYLLLVVQRSDRYKKPVLILYLLLTVTGAALTFFLAPECTCNILSPMDLLPHAIGVVMAMILLFKRSL